MRQNRKITIRNIALSNLLYQRFRTILIFVLLVVTTIALFLGEFLTESMREGIAETGERIGADIIVVPDTFVSSIENALFLGRPCTVNFDRNWLDKLGEVEGVDKVSSQLYISSLSSDCCDSPMQLIAFDIDADFAVVPWLAKDGITSLQDDEIILGANITKEIGDKVKYFGREFTVANVLEETGMGYDSSAFISYEAAFHIAKDPVYQRVLPFRSDNKVISMVLLDIAEGYGLYTVKDNIEKAYGDKDIAVYSTNQMLTKFSDSLNNINIYGTLIKVLFLLLSTVSLYAISSITIYLRRHEFGSMLSVGVSRRKIIRILVWEMFYVIVLASIVGIGIVCGIIFPFHTQIKSLFTIPYLLPSAGIIISMGFKMFAINLLVCAAASFQLFWKLNKMEAAELIKEVNG